jgi:uncharacterized OB-fold protein
MTAGEWWDETAAPYWSAATARRLEIQRCRSCARWIHFPAPSCPACGSAELGFEPVSGVGVVDTFTVVHRAFAPEVADEVPYAVGFVELPEQRGLRVFADFVGIAPHDVRIGLPVVVTFTDRDPWGLVPSFRPQEGP